MHYGETKRVRAVQGDQFIQDFKKINTIVVYADVTGRTFPVQKNDVWDRAKDTKIYYKMTDQVFQNGRLVMLIA